MWLGLQWRELAGRRWLKFFIFISSHAFGAQKEGTTSQAQAWEKRFMHTLKGIGKPQNSAPFLAHSYSHTAYLDYGGAPFIRVSRPLSARGGTLQTPLCYRLGLSQEDMARTKDITKEKSPNKRKKQRNRDPPPNPRLRTVAPLRRPAPLRHLSLPPPPSSPLPAPCAPCAPTPTPRSPRLSQPGPESPNPQWKGSLVPSGRTSHRQGGPGT